MLSNQSAKIFVTGHQGMVGSAFERRLRALQYSNIITRTRNELDLRNSEAVANFFQTEKPEVVLLIAARVGGIAANMAAPADFLYDNLMIQANIIHNCVTSGVSKLIFFGSSCIYPRECPQPMKEEYLLGGPLEPTNEGYAVAKIAGIKLAQYSNSQHGLRVLCVMPSNLYGPNDSFDPKNSHVLSALVKKFCDAVHNEDRNVTVWGSGAAKREFLHVEDLVDAVFYLDQKWDTSAIINVGPGTDISIRDLVTKIASLVGYSGEICWDKSKPDGMPRKCMDVSKLNAVGYETRVSLEQGLQEMIANYRQILSMEK